MTYSAVHQRLIRARGLASEHACAECGGQAADWAFDNGDPRGFSEDLDRYSPLCRSCHRKKDHRPKPACKRGHEFTEGNTLRTTNGGRTCRACNRIRFHQSKQRRSNA
jgi:hypothetical protein